MGTKPTPEEAISHLLGVDENHIEEVSNYLITIHTSYLVNEEGLSQEHRHEGQYYFSQIYELLKALKKIDRK